MKRSKWAKLLVLLAAVALLAAACGGNGSDGGSSDNADSGTDSTAAGGGAPDPAPGFDGSTITLGVITPQTGIAAVIGKPLTNGNQVYIDHLNAEGGIAGKYKVQLKVVDSQYTPSVAVQQYGATKGSVAAYVQILGTAVVNAILPQLKTDKIVAGPASLDSFWVPEQQLPELRRRFDRVLATKEFDVHDLNAARAYVAAYVGFFHLAEGEEHAHEHAHAAGAQHHGHH